MDPFELLEADHKKVAQLFDRLEAASGKAKLNIFQQIKSELDFHAHIEETILYPALEKPEETHDLTLEAYEEHAVVKKLLSELARAKSASDEWQAKATVLRENVEHHVGEEENELFDKAKNALSDQQIEAIGERMEAAKARKQRRPVARQSVAKGAKSSKKSGAAPGILSRIADFVGLGGDTATRKTAKKSPGKKTTAARKGTKGSVKAASSSKGNTVTAKTASTSKRSKSSAAKVSRKGSATRTSKRTTASRSAGGAPTRSSTGSGNKAARTSSPK